MSISLVVIRLEIADKYPLLHHIKYQASVSKCYGNNVTGTRDVSPAEWPVLVTDTLLSIHRGRREPAPITVTTLDSQAILEEMTALNSNDDAVAGSRDESRVDVGSKGAAITIELNKDSREVSVSSGSVPKIPSKESTPGPSSSKEGTPCLSDDGARRFTFKETIHFMSGNPMVDVTKGILHLFKENSKTSLDDSTSRSEMLCMLAVPTSMSVHDILQYTAPFNTDIQHMRIIRDANPNQYMVILKLRSQKDADVFYSTYNGQPFNSFETELCRLVYVSSVETTREFEEGGLPIPGHSELPTCPVCLERMDESLDGILTVLCNHSFHGECLSKWGDTSCPVCRFCQTPDESPDQRCLSCGASDSLWICLICGHVGCGRYAGGHAHRHFIETNHLFSLQVGNNRVWDYVRDNYVHRLLQSEGDGKVVSFEPDTSVTDTTKEEMVQGAEKLNALQLEYTHLLTTQLESQREYFEAKVAEAQCEALKEVEELRELAILKTKEAIEQKEQCDISLRYKGMLEKKVQTLTQKVNKITKDFETEKQLNLSLKESKVKWEVKAKQLEGEIVEKDKEVDECTAQVRDMMMHFEAQDAIRSNPELEMGQVGLPTQNKESKKGKRKS